ncbi:FkbM family methyltransferase [Algoriphagus namhaensis]|uniref:FkbM family methyltransferase n=1 Tax=Algoriphagus namhaensis TaxID=915353 RepID=A0ABV8ASF2_9BACT
MKFYFLRKKWERNRVKRKILSYLKSRKNLNDEEKEVYQGLESFGLRVFPYEFENRYRQLNVDIQFQDGFPFVKVGDKSLFFKKGWSADKSSNYYKSLILEQDPSSPHLYCDSKFQIQPDEIVIDIGVAEGSFTFDNIDKALKYYVFEKERSWIDPLKLTFEPFQNKVKIVEKLVSNFTSDESVKLDDFLEFYSNKIFIKIDVDGSEREVLEGMEGILKANQDVRLVICTYHKQNDLKDFLELFQKLGFNHQVSKGFMVFFYDKELSPPYLRRGVLRVWK